jgi:hypothetical protein
MLATSIERPLALRRRGFLSGAATCLLVPVALARTEPAIKPQPLVHIWKGPACGCCKDWIAHLHANGFRTQVSDSGNTDARARLGVQLKYGSCHTAQVGGFAVEGHVPAKDIHRLLKERPEAVGLAVPGMPIGSPGMDGPEYGARKDAYEVLLLSKDGSTRVYQTYR